MRSVKKLLFIAGLSASAAVQAASYYVVVPLPSKATASAAAANIAVSLNSYSLPQGTVGLPYSGFNLNTLLSVTGDTSYAGSGAVWQVVSGTIPAGLSLSSNGQLTGTPTSAGTGSFELKATYKTKSGQQSYQVVIAELVVGLASASLPQGLVGNAYSYDFKSLLSVTGDQAYSASQVAFTLASGSLPPGLSLSENGVLSGTPTAKNLAGASFEVLATYKTKSGQQAYTISVDGVLMNVTQLAVGESRACAVTTAGALKCWGKGVINTAATPASSSTPRTVDGLSSGVASVALGRYHNCIVTTGGAAKCWGDNGYGQLGDGTQLNKLTPVTPAGLESAVVQLSTSVNHSCAVKASGDLLCWGSNSWSQIGPWGANVTSPVTVISSGVTKVSTAENLTCAVVNSAAKCWGSNSYGETGMGSTTTYSLATPQQVVGLTSGVTEVAAARGFACAVHNSVAKCWGFNIYGNLGNGTTTASNQPVSVANVGGQITSLSAQAYGMCGITSAGAAYCWGYNAQGQLGDGTKTSRNSPVMVSGLSSGVLGLESNVLSSSTCVITASAVKCWGGNTNGQLGDGTTTASTVPVNVAP